MALATDTPRRTRRLTTVQIGTAQLPKVVAVAEKMEVSYATVVKWAIEQFDLSLFLADRQSKSTDDANTRLEVPA